MATINQGSFSKENYTEKSKELNKNGFYEPSSNLLPGVYSGMVDNIEEFISIMTYDKVNGSVKGGILSAVIGTVGIDGGSAFRVEGFQLSGGKRLLLNSAQIGLLSPGCSFTFEVTDKGYAAKVATLVENQTSEAEIKTAKEVTKEVTKVDAKVLV